MLDSAALTGRLEALLATVEAACRRAGRDAGEVRLVAVAKGFGPRAVGTAVRAGVTDIGENYVRELAAKAAEVRGVRWHYVGALQASTAHRVADLADVVHSLAPGRAAERLSARAERAGRRIRGLVQVDFTARPGRAGVSPDRTLEAVRAVAALPSVEVRGLMTLPPEPDEPEDSRPFFRRLRELRDDVSRTVSGLDELSMGMSADYEVAVEEGATMIRIGTALFGERPLASTEEE